MKMSLSIDELVQSVNLYVPFPVALHGYVLPYILSYIAWFLSLTFVYGWEDHIEIGMILLSIIGFLQILTCLCCYWSVHIRCLLTCRREKNPLKAEVAKVVPTANNGSPEIVKLHKTYNDYKLESIWFVFQKAKYIYDEEKKQFIPLPYPDSRLLKHYAETKGLSDDKAVDEARKIYGLNNLKMDIPEFIELFKDRATAPFFVFQVFCVGLWCLDEYWYYSVLTLFMLVTFECTLVQQQIRNMAEIRKMGNKPYMTQVFRCNKWRPIMSDELIPGDIVSIVRSKENLVPCDLLLLRGPCVVDESMLTGESVPQMKESLEGVDLDRELDLASDSKLHILFGGTKVVQHTSPAKQGATLKAPDAGCICYVLRTSFSTSQGRLLRTILYGVSRATANTLETLLFILFLLVFAVAAAAYVWVKGTEDPERNRYKLFLECTLILTSVVPPELPIELSLAVNQSLLSLAQLSVFCTEPFRIPFAGKVDICCFDKTGTLTSDELVVEGVSGIDGANEIIPVQESPASTVQVLASCHSLVQMDDGLVGDPQEKVTLSAIDWSLTKGESVIPKKGKGVALRIFQRYHFSSHLKRMSVVAGYIPPGTSEYYYIASVKGAPETLKNMFSHIPLNYDELYQQLTYKGARVLALGRKELGNMQPSQLRALGRENVESCLDFGGFLILSCPLKADSKDVIEELLHSSHAVVMITGDNSLTACHVAKELNFTTKDTILCLEKHQELSWSWCTIDRSFTLPVDFNMPQKKLQSFLNSYELCISGESLSWLLKESPSYLKAILPRVKVFARVAPKQKEHIITTYKSMGYTALMCGDGTNDVGALKHAHCGVAILSRGIDRNYALKHAQPSIEHKKSEKEKKLKKDRSDHKLSNDIKTPQKILTPKQKRQEEIQKLLKEIENMNQNQVIKLGDASIAAPFTSKLSSIRCVAHIIKQGRCTLVTTLQMFKILALHALIHAYSRSVLYLDGVKFSDYQATTQGILLAICFLFISRSKPLRNLSKARPLPSIVNAYTVMTVLLQFIVHFSCLIFLVREAKNAEPHGPINLESDFEPNILNSTVFIISMLLQISTFAVNYRGYPFMESLRDNTMLLYSILATSGVVIMLASGVSRDFALHFEIADFPDEFRQTLMKTLLGAFFASYGVDRLCLILFGEGKLPKELEL